MVTALREEHGFPADIVLWHGSRDEEHHTGVMDALRLAGDLLIGDHGIAAPEREAA